LNEQNYFQANDDGIGIDPTMVSVIETLDVLPKEEIPNKPKNKGRSKTPNPDKKPGDLLKKILFTIVILALMAGVSFGVYYYLSLGTKRPTAKFTLEDKVIFIGGILPTSVIDYGDFSTIDVSECSLNTKNVNVNQPGEYVYVITCGKSSASAKIIVKEKQVFAIESKFVYKTVGDEVEPSEFIKAEGDNYQVSFVNPDDVQNNLLTIGGPYVIDLKVVNEKSEETIVSALLYVISEDVNLYLTCNSNMQTAGGYDFVITDKIAFDDSKENLGISIRTHSYSFSLDTEYETMKNAINGGRLIINGNEGYALIDNVNMQLKIVSILSNEVLGSEYGSELPKAYNDINSYYRNTKKYSCSI